MIDECFELLGAVTTGAHIKDFQLEESLLPAFRETPVGHGMLDQVTFLRRLQAACPQAHVLLEHLTAGQWVPARAAVLGFAAEAGVSWDS